MVKTSPLRKILVTGASGFLGSAVARRAQTAGFDVFGVGRSNVAPRLQGSNIAYQALDLSNDDALGAYLGFTKPDVIVHAGWNGVAGRYKDQNVQYANIIPTCRLIELGAANGLQKFIGIGSQAEYGHYDSPISEDAPTNPTTLYGAAKLAACVLARQRAQDLGIDFAWLRLFAIYGEGDNSHWLIPSLIEALSRGNVPPMTQGRQICDYLHIDDAADAILSVISASRAQGVFNFCSGVGVSVKDIALILRDLIEPKLDLVFGAVAYGPNQLFCMQGSIEKLSAATGWSPKISMRDGLARTVQARLGAV
jgi:UDP-glucose 4-epimerase